MKTTPFTEKHISLGAKMHEFAGYNMPIEYSGIIDEHLTVCNAVGVFDVSHMGEFWVKGPNALAFLQKVTSNNVAALTPGKVQYTCFPNEEGGIVDDLLVYHYEPEKYLLVVNASNIEKDWNWCVSHNTEGAELENASDHMAQLAIQGPKAILALQKLTSINLSELPYYTFTHGEFAGEKDVIISNTGYTGAGGFELYFYPEAAMKIWNAVFEAGEESSRLAWVHAIRFVWKWASVCMAMIWMIRHHLLKPVWGGLPSLLKVRTLSIVRCLKSRKRKVLSVSWSVLKWWTVEFLVMDMSCSIQKAKLSE